MKMVIYRGNHEIGGNCIELKSGTSRILLDIGQPLVFEGLPVTDDMLEGSGPELVKRGILPAVKGLYAWDKPEFSGVIVSHGHLDHYGFSHFIHSEIPVWVSEGTKKIMELSTLFLRKPVVHEGTNTFTMYRPFQIGPFVIQPYLMDHSAFDAAAFEITAEGKSVIYTGDFRNHGRKAICHERFMERATKHADVLLIEGSTLGRPEYQTATEEELEEKIVSLADLSSGPIAYQCSSQNIDRLVTFYRAAVRAKRILVIDVYTANVLEELRTLGNRLPHPGPEYPNIKVYFPNRLTTRIIKTIGAHYARRFAPYRITRQEIELKAGKVMIGIRPSVQYILGRMPEFINGQFIYSLWEGYRQEATQKSFEEFLFRRGFETTVIHTSGHADPATLSKTIRQLAPKKVFPIHSFHRELFSDMSDSMEWVIDGDEVEIF